MATPCGHSFCGFRVNKFQTHGTDKTCQKCGTNVTGFCRNLLANSVLEREEGECVYCHEKFTLDKAKDHVWRCVLFPVDCSFCRQPVKRKDLQQHMEGCPFGDVVCACGLTIKRKDQESHVATTCPFREEPCPLKCGDSVKRLVYILNNSFNMKMVVLKRPKVLHTFSINLLEEFCRFVAKINGSVVVSCFILFISKSQFKSNKLIQESGI